MDYGYARQTTEKSSAGRDERLEVAEKGAEGGNSVHMD